MPDNIDAAIAILTASGGPSAPDAPPTDAPAATPDATPPVDAPPADAPPAPDAPPTPPADAPVAPPQDDTAELMAKLEERRARRMQQQAPAADDPAARIAKLEQEIAALRQAPPPRPVQDFAALLREHGEVEALRMIGVDPIEFYNRFKEVARDPASLERRRAEAAERERIAKLEEDLGTVRSTLTEAQQRRQQEIEAENARQAWANYNSLIVKPETNTPLLARLPSHKQQEVTQQKIAWLTRNGYDVDLVDDVALARLVERDLRETREQLLAGTDAAASTTKPAPTDKPTSAQPGTTTLSNDVAATNSGKRKPMTADERLAAAISIVQRGP